MEHSHTGRFFQCASVRTLGLHAGTVEGNPSVRVCGSPLGGAHWHTGFLPCGRFGGWSVGGLERKRKKVTESR